MSIVHLTPRPELGEGYFDEIEFSPGSPPPRPGQRPPLGIWGPNDPRPTPPITGIPGFPPPLGPPPGGGPVPPVTAPVGANATVIPLPKTDPPATPPEGMPASSMQALVWFGPGTKPALAWIGPYASTGPVGPAEADPVAPKSY